MHVFVCFIPEDQHCTIVRARKGHVKCDVGNIMKHKKQEYIKEYYGTCTDIQI